MDVKHLILRVSSMVGTRCRKAEALPWGTPVL